MQLVRLIKSVASSLKSPMRMLFWTLVFSVAFVSQGNASLITPNLNLFVLNNIDSDGSVLVLDQVSFLLTGGNTGSGIPGRTEFSGISPIAGLLQFQYSYASNDYPGFDFGGYLLGGSRFQLADTDGAACNNLGGVSCVVAIPVAAGEAYGWYVDTFDNLGEPGVLTVSLITGPGSTAPEPAGLALVLIGLAAMAVRRLRSIRAQACEEPSAS
jgi:hypothetical protein